MSEQVSEQASEQVSEEVEKAILTKKDVKDFQVKIDTGYLYWLIKLKDNTVYQIKFRIVPYITPAGNKSKRKIYFIRVDDKELIFNNDVKKCFFAFRRPYLISGI